MKISQIQSLAVAAVVASTAAAVSCRTNSSATDPSTLPDLYSGEVALDPGRLISIPSPTPSGAPDPIIMTVPLPENFKAKTKASGPQPKNSKKSSRQSPSSSSPAPAPVAVPISPSPQPSPSPTPTQTAWIIPTDEDYRNCKSPEVKPSAMNRDQAYTGVLFQPGEKATYEVFYGGVLGGYGAIEVDNPTLIDGLWHRVLKAEASTGDWFKSIFVGKYKILSWSRPWDFGIRRFYMETDEGKLFGSRTALKKWVEFDHGGCAGNERTLKNKNPEKLANTFFQRSSTDVLGAYFALRNRSYKIGRIENIPVYTGEKNWTLEATPIANEDVETAAGKFATTRLKLQTYIGQELQQKGDVHIWIAESLKERILVQVKADVKVGSIYVKLKEFRPGGF